VKAAYATVAELTAYIDGSVAIPADAARLLTEASALLDYRQTASNVTFAIDPVTGLPTDTEVAEAMRDAACAQVRALIESGEGNDIDGLAGTEIHAGAYSGTRMPELARRAKRYLKLARLL